MEVNIGLTGWGDHPSLYEKNSKYKLTDYSAHFPVVEVDSTFYALPNESVIQKWIHDTPSSFQFIVKAYRGMTGHEKREHWPFDDAVHMFRVYEQTLMPMHLSGKLAFVLFQFPPSFTCEARNVNLLRFIRQRLPQFDVAIEFRHASWLEPSMRSATLQFLREHRFIHTIVDEPQVGRGCVPLLPVQTHPSKIFYRFHGRHDAGWVNTFESAEEWRSVRYLYDYNDEELHQFEQMIRTFQAEQYVIFNNNSGHHASPNAKSLMEKLDVTYDNLATKQLNLFEGE